MCQSEYVEIVMLLMGTSLCFESVFGVSLIEDQCLTLTTGDAMTWSIRPLDPAFPTCIEDSCSVHYFHMSDIGTM